MFIFKFKLKHYWNVIGEINIFIYLTNSIHYVTIYLGMLLNHPNFIQYKRCKGPLDLHVLFDEQNTKFNLIKPTE